MLFTKLNKIELFNISFKFNLITKKIIKSSYLNFILKFYSLENSLKYSYEKKT